MTSKHKIGVRGKLQVNMMSEKISESREGEIEREIVYKEERGPGLEG